MIITAPSVRRGRWEVQDFPGVDERGDIGLVTKMRIVGGGRTWVRYDLDVMLADEAVNTGRNIVEQDVWWTGRDRITCAIDDLTDDRRRFIARLLINQSAATYARSRARRIQSDFWSYVEAADDANWGPANLDDEPTAEQIHNTIRTEQDKGAHLDWMRSSKLFQRMIRDLEWTHAGVTGTELDRPR